MPEFTSNSSESTDAGLAFLQDLEARHDRVLAELDALQAQVEEVLEDYLRSRDASAASNGRQEAA